MATFSKTYFNKALLNCQFHSSLTYDIVSLGKKGILTCREAAYLNKSVELTGETPCFFVKRCAILVCIWSAAHFHASLMRKIRMNVLITGISRGLGLALAKEYFQHGDNVFGISRSVPVELPEGVRHLSADITLDESKKIIENFVNDVPCIDVLINI